MDPREVVKRALADCVRRLDTVLQPWGFVFKPDKDGFAHTGLFASGKYVRESTRIGFACRDTIDDIFYIYYAKSFLTQHLSWQSVEEFGLGHPGLMDALGHRDDCQLVELIGGVNIHAPIVARDGGDPVAAWIHDLSVFAAPVLQEPSAEFDAIMQQGSRYYSVSY